MAEARSSPRGRVGIFAGLHMIALILAVTPSALRADQPRPGEYQVKAAFLYNFAKFVEWPAGMIGTGKSTIVVGVLGNDPFGAAPELTFEGKSLAGRHFAIRRYSRIEQLQSCHILFIGGSEKRDLRKILSVIRGAPVLTVSDTDEFVETGGMIELLLDDKKIRFDINLHETKRSGLRISAPLLQLARRVEGK